MQTNALSIQPSYSQCGHGINIADRCINDAAMALTLQTDALTLQEVAFSDRVGMIYP